MGVFNTHALHPEALAYDSVRGLLWVADSGNRRILGLDAFGRLKFSLSGGDQPFVKPTGVAVAKDASVYVVDQGRDMLLAFDASLNFAWAQGGPGYEVAKFDRPYHGSV